MDLQDECRQLLAILIATVKTAKKQRESQGEVNAQVAQTKNY